MLFISLTISKSNGKNNKSKYKFSHNVQISQSRKCANGLLQFPLLVLKKCSLTLCQYSELATIYKILELTVRDIYNGALILFRCFLYSHYRQLSHIETIQLCSLTRKDMDHEKNYLEHMTCTDYSKLNKEIMKRGIKIKISPQKI